ncbi:MAG: transposase [Chthoniobacterales bacterium]
MKKKRFTEEQIVSILREGERGDKTIEEICRAHAVSTPTYYVWKRKFGSMQESDVRRLRELEKDNARLKKLLAERDIEIDVMKEFLEKK